MPRSAISDYGIRVHVKMVEKLITQLFLTGVGCIPLLQNNARLMMKSGLSLGSHEQPSRMLVDENFAN